MAETFGAIADRTLKQAALAVGQAIVAEHQRHAARSRPSSVRRRDDGRDRQPDAIDQAIPSRVVFDYGYMDDVAQFALEVLRERSPIGSGRDPHPGLYRDSHLLFLNGQVVRDVKAWRPGDEIEISNPQPYARKIEVGGIKVNTPPHVYEGAVPLINARYGNQARIEFAYRPIQFAGVGDWSGTASARRLAATIRGGNPGLHQEWLVRQPAIVIKAL